MDSSRKRTPSDSRQGFEKSFTYDDDGQAIDKQSQGNQIAINPTDESILYSIYEEDP